MCVNNCILSVYISDFYISDKEVKRDPLHILWCLCFTLIRSLNEKLITNYDYLVSLVLFITKFEDRLINVLDIAK